MTAIDRLTERVARRLARRSDRRSVLARLGAFVVGASVVPLLPIARGLAAAADGAPAKKAPAEVAGPEGDPTRCEYWRHCAIDGFLCSCCGGSQTACPPGTEMSPVTWIGTCRNPADGKDYAIWYNDCCGRGFCGRCFCNRNEGDRPVYHPYRSNDINWCAGASSQIYHCSTALVIGLAEEGQPEK
jgi:methylamine dehydrogenase light chain